MVSVFFFLFSDEPLKVVTVKGEQSTMNDQFIKTIELLKLHHCISVLFSSFKVTLHQINY